MTSISDINILEKDSLLYWNCSVDKKITVDDNFIIKQEHNNYATEDHALWKKLCDQQEIILKNRASKEFLDGLAKLDINSDKIPDFERLSDKIEKITGWRIVAVPGLVPDDIFFSHLANKRFPCSWWIRPPDKIDYIQEPDIFHDLYGHVPLLINPFFSDFIQLYGKKGMEALKENSLHYLARLYWYTVEFGLINTNDGLKIFGSGIISSKDESIYCLESNIPNRIKFDLKRIMSTEYIIDTFQSTYFVIDSYERLYNDMNEKLPLIYNQLHSMTDYPPNLLLDNDEVYRNGTFQE